MNDCQADVIQMRMDDLKELIEDSYSCVGCLERTCRYCDIGRRRMEALSDE